MIVGDGSGDIEFLVLEIIFLLIDFFFGCGGFFCWFDCLWLLFVLVNEKFGLFFWFIWDLIFCWVWLFGFGVGVLFIGFFNVFFCVDVFRLFLIIFFFLKV